MSTLPLLQGTACITLAGLLSAARATGKSLIEHRVLFLGAGEAGTGIGELIAHYLHLRHGLTVEQGRQHCFYLDSRVSVTLGAWEGQTGMQNPHAITAPALTAVLATRI